MPVTFFFFLDSDKSCSVSLHHLSSFIFSVAESISFDESTTKSLQSPGGRWRGEGLAALSVGVLGFPPSRKRNGVEASVEELYFHDEGCMTTARGTAPPW